MTIRTEPYKFTTLQQLFDDMYIPVVRQGRPSLDAEVGCALRGEDGTACAFGYLLTDEQSERCGNGYLGFQVLGSEIQLVLRELGINMLQDREAFQLAASMQLCHDNSAKHHSSFVAEFKRRAAEVAERFGLTVPEVKS